MMPSSTIRKAIGAVKDHTSISLAKVTGNSSPDLEVLIVRATSHHDEPADEKYAREILTIASSSRGNITTCVYAISKRLSKTRDWIVALKALMLLHKLLSYGNPVFGQELNFVTWKGTRVLNMSKFRDDAHSNSWDHSDFVRSFASYLDEKLVKMLYEQKSKKKCHEVSPDQKFESMIVAERLNFLLKLLDRFLACRPKGAAKNTRMVLVALNLLVKESFRLYADISDDLNYFRDCFHELKYCFCVMVFDAYVKAAKMMDELVAFYSWCKELESVRSSEFPEVQKISHELLGKLEAVIGEKRTRQKCPNETSEEETPSKITAQNINEIKALPPPENFNPQQQTKELTENLLNLDFDHQESDNLGLALFSTNVEGKTTSAWQNPAAENGKSDWELVLVDSTSNLSKQKADLGGGFNSLMLNGMYEHGTTVTKHASNGGSASSVALPEINEMVNKVLALPAPDVKVKAVGQQDPFAASLSVPPPSYVQIADMEKKRDLVTQEQQLWQQYSTNGMQGPMGFAKIASYYNASMPQGYYYV